jgi:hypothetical protein
MRIISILTDSSWVNCKLQIYSLLLLGQCASIVMLIFSHLHKTQLFVIALDKNYGMHYSERVHDVVRDFC